jgi:hypothetical protein
MNPKNEFLAKIDKISVQNLEKGEKSAINAVLGLFSSNYEENFHFFFLISSYMMSKYDDMTNKYDYLMNKNDDMRSKYDYLFNKYDYMNNKYNYLQRKYDYLNNMYDYMKRKYDYLFYKYNIMNHKYDDMNNKYDDMSYMSAALLLSVLNFQNKKSVNIL